MVFTHTNITHRLFSFRCGWYKAMDYNSDTFVNHTKFVKLFEEKSVGLLTSYGGPELYVGAVVCFVGALLDIVACIAIIQTW